MTEIIKRIEAERRKKMRREDDVCPYHDMCFERQDDKHFNNQVRIGNMEEQVTADGIEQKKAVNAMLPRWVFVLALTLTVGFTAWTAIKGIGTSERLAKVETVQEIMFLNINKTMEHFAIAPVVTAPKKGVVEKMIEAKDKK